MKSIYILVWPCFLTQKHAKLLRRSVLQLIQSLHGARSSWGPARVLERWVYAQLWSVSTAMLIWIMFA